jgi:hypothetical protein
MRILRSSVAGAAVIIVVGACSKSSSGPPADTCTGSTVTLTANQVTTLPQADAWCMSMPADGSTYLVVPNFGSGAGPASPVGIEIGSGPPAAQDRLPMIAAANADLVGMAPQPPRGGTRERFEAMMRTRERSIAASVSNRPKAQLRALVSALPVLGDTRIFNVCTDLNCSVYKKDTAQVQYVGNRIVIYISQNAPAGGYTAQQITAVGNTFDIDLFPIDSLAFGAPSDIDANARVLVLMSPKVNGMVTASECQQFGYIAGYFDGLDLSTFANSNNSEVFYSVVPDPAGQFSCAHSVASATDAVLPTFIHEFQHMISYNQHVFVNAGQVEDVWLNEGLSHMAEELGSLYYENKYPVSCGCQRNDPTQLFPDSSQGFISGDLANSYSYLQTVSQKSVTLYDPLNTQNTLPYRGAAWLFLRWLVDQKGQGILRTLENTSLTGTSNISAAGAEPFAALFQDFAMAVYSDSLANLPRNTVVARDRFASRNLRQLYNRLFVTLVVPAAWPFLVQSVPIAGKTGASLMVGSMTYWKVSMPSTGSEMRLHFAANGGGAFPAGYNAQVTVLRCPSAAACP